MKAIKLVPALLLSAMLVACGSSDKGAEIPPPSVLSSSSSSSSQATSTSSVASSSSQQSSSSEPALDVAWNIYDGNGMPFATGVVQLSDGSNTEFTLGGDEGGMGATYFNLVGDGTVNLDTTAVAAHQHYAYLNNVVANDGEYPKYFTLIAGVTGPAVSNRVIDFEIAMADAGAEGTRIKAVIRADGDNTGVQLERIVPEHNDSRDSRQQWGYPMLDVYRVYHFAIELTEPTRGNVRVYFDGNDAPVLAVENEFLRRTASDGQNYLRIGDIGGSGYQSNIDWVIWTDEAAYTPSQLAGALPENIGVINGYAEDESGSSSSSPDIAAQYEFETDALNTIPAGFTASGSVHVSDLKARMGERSIQMTRLNAGNVNFRRTVGPTPTGVFKSSIFVPDNIQKGTSIYITLFSGGHAVNDHRAAEVILDPGAAATETTEATERSVKNRAPEGMVIIEGINFNLDAWNDIEMAWTDIGTTGVYTLRFNGQDVGTLPVEHVGRIPDRFEIKMGSSNSPLSPDISIFVDSVTAF